MKTVNREWVSTDLPPEYVELVNAVARHSPQFRNRSDLLRTGIRLALEQAALNGIDDPDLELRVLRYLHETKGH